MEFPTFKEGLSIIAMLIFVVVFKMITRKYIRRVTMLVLIIPEKIMRPDRSAPMDSFMM